MATDSRQELDKKTRKLSTAGQIKDGKEHEAYQETQQQLLAIQAERQQNLALARAESKADTNLNQTLAQAAELGAVSAAETEQAAMAGGIQTLNPATQAVLSKYGMGQPKIQRTSSHNQQVTKQNITINNNTTVTTKNDVTVPAGIGGPLQGRPVQFKAQTQASDSAGKFKSWISSAFARQNEEGARRDREYRHRESSLTKSASKMMKKLEDIGKTIGTRLDPRKIGSTWQSQLKTLLFLFGFGYLASNWVDILKKIDTVGNWIKGTWTYFTGEGKGGDTPFITSIKALLGARGSESFAEIFRNLLIGDESSGEKGLFGHIKQYFKDVFEERKEAIKLVKFPTIDPGGLDNDPLKIVQQLFGYLGDIFSAAVGGLDSIRDQKINEIKSAIDSNAELERKKSSPSDKFISRKVNGEDVNVEQGTLAYKNSFGQKEYKGISHHMLENGELTDKFGAESSMSQMSELDKLVTTARTTGSYNAEAMATAVGRLSKFAGKKGFIPVNKHSLTSILSADDIKYLEDTGKLKRNIPYRVVIREKNDEDYLRNKYGNNYTDVRTNVAASAAWNTAGKKALYPGGGMFSFAHLTAHGYLGEAVEDLFSPGVGTAQYVRDMYNEADRQIKEGQSKYRHEFIRADSPLRPGDIDTGNIEYLDEISKEGIKELSKLILSRYNDKFDESVEVDPENLIEYTNLIKQGAVDQFEGYKKERSEQIDREISNLSDNSTTAPIPLRPTNREFKFIPTPGFGEINTNNPEANSQRINELIQEKNQLSNSYATSLIDHSTNLLGETLSEYEEAVKRKEERDAQRQSDWENSAPGRMANAWSEKVIDPVIEGTKGILGTFTGSTVNSSWASKHKQKWEEFLLSKGYSQDDANRISGLFAAQEALESDNGRSRLAKEHNNFGGVGATGPGKGNHFNSVEDYMAAKLKLMEERFPDSLEAKTVVDFVKAIGDPERARNGKYLYFAADKDLSNGTSKNTFSQKEMVGKTQTQEFRNKQTQAMNKYLSGMSGYYSGTGSSARFVTSGKDGSDGVVIPGTVDFRWVSCVNEVTTWYNKNIHTYQGNPNGGKGTPKYYDSPWGRVRDDCSGLVSACITAYYGKYFSADSLGLSDQNNEAGSILKGLGFGYIKFTTWGSLHPYDIIVSPSDHAEIYAGNINGTESAFSWGSVHDQKKNPDGSPWPANTKKPYKVIWRNGSGSGPDFMYKNGVAETKEGKDSGETSFLSIMFSSITDTLKDFSQGLMSSDNDLASSLGKGLNNVVDAVDRVFGKTEDVEKAVKEKELEIPKQEASTNISSEKLDLNNLTEKDYTILRELVKNNTTSGVLDFNGFTKSLKDKYNIDLEKWYKEDGNVEAKEEFKKKLLDESNIPSFILDDLNTKKSETNSDKYISYNQFISESNLDPMIHRVSDVDLKAPIISSENNLIGNETNFLDNVSKLIDRDNSLSDNITNAISDSDGNQNRTLDKLDMIARVIGGATDSINANTASAASIIASSINRGSNSGISTGSYNSKANNVVYYDT